MHHRSHRIRHLHNLNDRCGNDDDFGDDNCDDDRDENSDHNCDDDCGDYCDDNFDDNPDDGNDDEENLNQTNTFVHAVFADFVQRVPT